MTENKYYGFKDGMPTGPDVSALQKEFPELKPGDVIAYDDVSAVIGSAWKTNRFKTVTEAWRRRALDAGIVIGCDATKAFRVLTADEISGKTYGTLEQIGRKAKKQRGHLSTIRSDDDSQKSTVIHQMTLMLAIERDAKKHRMNLIPSTAVHEVTKIGPPKEKSA